MTNHIVIMAGGVGSRLYPVSTPEKPKQFLDLLGCGRTLIQLTYRRFLELDPDAVFWVVTSARYVPFVREQLPDIPMDRILSEPEARNTAPCIAYACWKIKSRYADANVVVTPSDAYVPDCKAFAATIGTALQFASSVPSVICVGIKPSTAHTGYGYIKVPLLSDDRPVRVVAFKEKPDAVTAGRYISEGGYYWNAGIFIWTVEMIERELRRYAPGITDIMDRLAPSFNTAEEGEKLAELFPLCEKISIDYAVMEKSSEVYMVPGNWFWSDLGSFEAVEKITGKDLRQSIESNPDMMNPR